MADPGGSRDPRRRSGWRRLGWFWLATLALIAIGSGAIQWLGPPATNKPAAPSHAASVPPGGGIASVNDAKALVVMTGPRPVAPGGSGRDTPGAIADPDATLSEPIGGGSKEKLPKIAADGRTAMRVYAAAYDRSSRRPRVGILLAGMGLNEASSDAALRTLPGAVSVAISPYALNLTRLLATARMTGHEYLVAVPLEPAGFPLNDPGPSTLLTSLSTATNIQNLHWALSRIEGYVGVTGVIGIMRGERLAAMDEQMDAILTELAERGLLYIDPRTASGPHAGPGSGAPLTKAWGRHVDLVIDDPEDRGVADRTMIDTKLAGLEEQAKDTGSALGLVMLPTPVAIARIAAWSNGLADRGVALAPVSALVLPPTNPVKLSEREH